MSDGEYMPFDDVSCDEKKVEIRLRLADLKRKMKDKVIVKLHGKKLTVEATVDGDQYKHEFQEMAIEEPKTEVQDGMIILKIIKSKGAVFNLADKLFM